MIALLDKLDAILRRDLLTALRYRRGFVLTAAGALAELAAFYYLARAVGPGFQPEGTSYFPFLVVGTGLYTFLLMSINAFLIAVQEAQQTGTLEVLMTTATPPYVLVMLSAFSAFGRNTIQFLFYLAAGFLLVRDPFAHPNLLGALLTFMLSLLVAASLGLLAAALQIAAQKGSAVIWLLGSGAWFITGTLFPVATLPPPLRVMAQVIPITHSLNAMRMALLQGTAFTGLLPEIMILAGFCAVLLPSSLLIFSYTLRRARVEGTLSFY